MNSNRFQRYADYEADFLKSIQLISNEFVLYKE